MVTFKKIEFTRNGTLLASIENTTLPDAIAQIGKNIALDTKVTISCYYF